MNAREELWKRIRIYDLLPKISAAKRQAITNINVAIDVLISENRAEAVAESRQEVERLRAELESYRAFERSVNESLNCGDGSYKP